MEFPNLLSLNAYKIWAAIGKTVAGKGLPQREMTASWPDWLRRSGFAAPSDWLGCGRRLEWRHLTKQHMEGCMNRFPLLYTSCKTFAQWQTMTEAAEVVQREEERRKTTEQWSSVMFSDESKFVISFGNKGPRVWRKKGERNTDDCEEG